jgi:hypothetical protein
VRVDVQRRRRVAVSQAAGHGPHVDAGAEQPRGDVVAEVVETHVLQPDLVARLPEPTRCRVRVPRRRACHVAGEHERIVDEGGVALLGSLERRTPGDRSALPSSARRAPLVSSDGSWCPSRRAARPDPARDRGRSSPLPARGRRRASGARASRSDALPSSPTRGRTRRTPDRSRRWPSATWRAARASVGRSPAAAPEAVTPTQPGSRRASPTAHLGRAPDAGSRGCAGSSRRQRASVAAAVDEQRAVVAVERRCRELAALDTLAPVAT